jgi:predicted regulator of Ras-like GTPase activity (Roadblock/LC7/MglB family)
MAMKGSLKDMDVATLIQHNCQDMKTAQLDVTKNDIQATLFFKDGNVAHATLGNLEGEEVVYKIINWNEGEFSLEVDVETPKVSIERSWSGLLLEAAQRMDEAGQTDDLLDISEEPDTRERGILADTIASILSESSDIEGAAVVGTDGLVYSANIPQTDLDENMVGAVSAAIFGLGNRSVTQLKRGNFNRVLIQGKDGYIIVAGLNSETLFIGLTESAVNLGMAMAEVREITTRLKDIL